MEWKGLKPARNQEMSADVVTRVSEVEKGREERGGVWERVHRRKGD